MKDPQRETCFWQRDIETAGRSEMRTLQENKLKRILEYVQARSGFYQRKYARHGISVSAISTIEDLQRLPFTEREEIVRDQEEYGEFGSLRCNDFTEPGQAIGQTGDRFSSTGRPIRVITSLTDLATQGMLSARGLISAGISSKDYVYIADFPQFNLIYLHTGLGSINVQAISLLIGMERTERNVNIYMDLYPPTALFISPTYARFMAGLVLELGRKFPIKTLIGWNEPGYSLPAVRASVEELWRKISLEPEVKVCDAYGLMETGYLGFECERQQGIHGFEDCYIYEVIDPETQQLLTPGHQGELVVTHLEREAMPLIRYRTGDVTTLDETPCPCGRTHLRMKGIKGRWAERLVVKGKTVFASQVDEAMARIGGDIGRYNILWDGSSDARNLEIAVDEGSAGESTLANMKLGMEKQLDVPVKMVRVPASNLVIYPHRSRRVIKRASREDCRREAAAQMAVET